jgi:hypothetical protein
MFGWADRGGVRVGGVGGDDWAALSPRLRGSDLEANGLRWRVEDSEGNVDL